MRFWVSRGSEVSLRDQLTAQVVLGITSGELAPGAKLASTRALARQLKVHPNTVSAAYRDLAARGWLERRKGSGVFVRGTPAPRELAGSFELDRLIIGFIRAARSKGFTLAEIRKRAQHWLSLQPPDHFLIVEDDGELCRILAKEIEAVTSFPVETANLDACRDPRVFARAQPVALSGRSGSLLDLLPSDTTCLWLQTRSVRGELERTLRPVPAGEIVNVISRWPEFLQWGRTILLAAGIEPESVSFHDARELDWKQVLGASGYIVTDALTTNEIPKRYRNRTFTFKLLPDSSLSQIREFIDGLG